MTAPAVARDGAIVERLATRPGRPWWVWAGSFAVMAGILCVRNAFLFTSRIYEMADMAANSILIEQARRFQLLVGDYSRLGFHHPGPAYMYVQAAGESVFYDMLHVVPTPWNGQVLAVYALNSAFVAMAVVICYGWQPTLTGALASLAVLAAFAAVHPPAMSSDWMSYEYVTPYLVFVIAASSVAAGHGQDAWIMALTGWFLIHGQATFLVFVPVITLAVLAAVGWRVRRSPLRALRSFFAQQRRVWVPVAAISAVFLLPIVLELVLHWPGYFGQYLKYSSSGSAGGHTLSRAWRYLQWYWSGRHRAPWLPLVLYAVAAAAAWLLGSRRRGFLVALLAVNLVSSVLLLWYAANAVDHLNDTYIGYFYWSAPAVTGLVIVLALAEAAGGWPVSAVVAGGLAVVALAAFALAPWTRTSTTWSDQAVRSSPHDTDPALARAVALLAARSPSRTLVLYPGHLTWVSMNGLLVQAERTGVAACDANGFWEYMVTSEFICTKAQVRAGTHYTLLPPADAAARRHALVVLRSAVVVAGPRGT
jgi:hypothetical protein